MRVIRQVGQLVAFAFALAGAAHQVVACGVKGSLASFGKAGWQYVEGRCINGLVQGEGKATSQSWGEYAGEFNHGWFNGHGTWVTPSGDKYDGEWSEGKLHGQGTYWFSNGAKYSGDFVDGAREGSGTQNFPDGTKYVGQFKANKANGQGTLFDAKENVIYSGAWRSGERFEPGAPFDIKTGSSLDYCNEVVYPGPREQSLAQWLTYPGRLVQYHQNELLKLDRMLTKATGRRTEMHRILDAMRDCVVRAGKALEASEHLAIAACDAAPEHSNCLLAIGSNFRSAERSATNVLLLPFEEAQERTYTMVGRP